MWLVFIVAIPLVRSGEIPGAMLAALGLMALSAFEAVQPLPQAVEILSSSREAGSRLMEILDSDPPVADPANPAPFPPHPAVHIQDLSFSYPGSREVVLQDINLQLGEGQKLAIVGPSGSGKSTLGNLILRFWSGYEGEINLGANRTPLRTLAQEEVRQGISVVSQGTDLFNDTLRANIALGKPGAEDSEILAAAQKARLEEWIQSLPDGLETQLGERGTQISAGERQRVAIARAVLKDAPSFCLTNQPEISIQ
ncbi:MAG: hypothetical protein DRI46_06105 [Chloroflexi bacterium]|nr:MAG: hypothetical protein DRI46_06105 [Chloroflexota bacterium]